MKNDYVSYSYQNSKGWFDKWNKLENISEKVEGDFQKYGVWKVTRNQFKIYVSGNFKDKYINKKRQYNVITIMK